jgi:DNA polymerase-3 subunit gamma/tau
VGGADAAAAGEVAVAHPASGPRTGGAAVGGAAVGGTAVGGAATDPAGGQAAAGSSDPAPSVQQSPAGAGSLDVAGMRRIWPEVLDTVKRRRRTTHALLMNASVHSVDEGILTLTISSLPLSRLLADEINLDCVRGAVRDVLGVDWQVRVVVDGEAEAAFRPAGGATRPDPPEEDPREDEPSPGGAGVGPQPGGGSADPEEAAISLLESTLGARRIEPGG